MDERKYFYAHEWESLDKPILSIHDKDAQWWEKLTQYKSVVYWDKDKTLGAPFVMFYNAAGRHPETDLKAERVGIAFQRYEEMETLLRKSGLCARSGRNHYRGCAYPENGRRVCHVLFLGF